MYSNCNNNGNRLNIMSYNKTSYNVERGEFQGLSIKITKLGDFWDCPEFTQNEEIIANVGRDVRPCLPKRIFYSNFGLKKIKKNYKFMLTFEIKNGIIKKYQVNMKTYFI